MSKARLQRHPDRKAEPDQTMLSHEVVAIVPCLESEFGFAVSIILIKILIINLEKTNKF